MNLPFSLDSQDFSLQNQKEIINSNEFSKMQLNEENIILKEENQSLKSQLSRINIEIFPELENAHLKIQNLTTQYQESKKSCDNLQNRLKLSQMKSQEMENKRMEIEAKNAQLQNEKNSILSKCQEIQKEVNLLNQAISESKKENNQLKSEEQQFFDRMRSLTGFQIYTFSEVYSAFQKLKEEKETINRDLNQSQELNSQNDGINPEIAEKIKNKIRKYKESIRQLQTENQSLKDKLSQKDIGIQKLKKNEELANSKLQDTLSQLQDQKDSFSDKEKDFVQIYQEKEKWEIECNKKEGIIQDLKFQNQNLKAQLSNKAEQNKQLSEQFAQKVTTEQDINNQLQQSKQLINQLQENYSKASTKLNSVIKNKKHLKARLAEVEKESKAQIYENSKEINSLQLDLNKLEEDNTALLSQLEAAKASHAEANSAYNSAKKDAQQMEKALEIIKSIVEKQKVDFQSYFKEKDNLMKLIRKQSQALIQFDDLFTNEHQNAKNLEQQVKKLENEKENEKRKLAEFENSIDSKCLEIINNAFTKKLDNEDEIRNRLVPIVVSDTISPSDKISNIFEIILEKLNQLGELKQKDAIAQKELQKYQKRSLNADDQSRTVLRAVISGFHKFLSNQENSPNESQDIISYISSETERIETYLKENSQPNSQFNIADLLFKGSLDDRKRAIQSISKEGWNSDDTFDLFTIMALINICQEKELIKIRPISDQLSQIQQSLGCSNSDEVISVVSNLNKKLKKAKSQNKSLLDEIQNSSSIIPQNDELQQSIQDKDADIQNLNNKIAKLLKENDILNQKNLALEKVKNDLKIQIHQQSEDNQKHVFELEKTINEKQNEFDELYSKLNMTTSKINSLQENINNKEEQIKQIQAENESLVKRHKMKEKQNKQKVKQVIQKYEEIGSQLEKNKKDLEEKLNETIKNEKVQNKEKDLLINKLSESLENSEKRNQRMLYDISRLKINNNSLEMKIQSLNDQMNREEQMLNAKFDFKLMAEKTKHQEELVKTKIEYLTERDRVIIHVLNCFDELDQFDDQNINVEEFENAVDKVGKNYLKLKRQQ